MAPNATIIGDVSLGDGSSLWHGVTARGDIVKIEIGKNVVVQDLTTLTSSLPRKTDKKDDIISEMTHQLQIVENDRIRIGDNVVIGPLCKIGKAVIEENALVGDKATVGDGCLIEAYAVLAGGAVLEGGQVIPTGQIWAGNPAKYLRDVTIEEKLAMVENAQQLNELAKIYAEETEKSEREVLSNRYKRVLREDSDDPLGFDEKMRQQGYPVTEEDMLDIEQRVETQYSGPQHTEKPLKGWFKDKEYHDRNWEPLTYDSDKMSDVLKKYGVNTEMYEKSYQRFKHEPAGLEKADHPFEGMPSKDMSPWEKKFDNSKRRFPSST